MKAVLVTGYGDPSVVTIGEVPDPVAGAGEVLIRVRTAAVNSAEWRLRTRDVPTGFGLMIRLIFGWSKPKHPIMGAEAAGTVEAVGPGVQGIATGDEVYAMPKSNRGCHAEFAVATADRVIPKPAVLSWTEAGAMGFGGVTALHFLGLGGIAPGKRVLVIGAAGAVGSAAVQIAKAKGAHVTAVCSAASREIATGLGADDIIDYRAEDVTARAERWDIVMDTVGALPFGKARRIMTAEGRYLGIAAGLPAMLGAIFNPLRRQKAVYSVANGERPLLKELAALAEAGKYTPLIDSVLPMDQAREAHARVEAHRKHGSVVLQMVND